MTKSGQTQYDIAYRIFAPLHDKKLLEPRTVDAQVHTLGHLLREERRV